MVYGLWCCGERTRNFPHDRSSASFYHFIEQKFDVHYFCIVRSVLVVVCSMKYTEICGRLSSLLLVTPSSAPLPSVRSPSVGRIYTENTSVEGFCTRLSVLGSQKNFLVSQSLVSPEVDSDSVSCRPSGCHRLLLHVIESTRQNTVLSHENNAQQHTSSSSDNIFSC